VKSNQRFRITVQIVLLATHRGLADELIIRGIAVRYSRQGAGRQNHPHRTGFLLDQHNDNGFPDLRLAMRPSPMF
jgi:hypothetical protein